jgi:hypothetical protein
MAVTYAQVGGVPPVPKAFQALKSLRVLYGVDILGLIQLVGGRRWVWVPCYSDDHSRAYARNNWTRLEDRSESSMNIFGHAHRQ